MEPGAPSAALPCPGDVVILWLYSKGPAAELGKAVLLFLLIIA